MKDIYHANYKILIKEIEEDTHTRKRKNIPYSRIGKINIVKISILIRANYRFYPITIKKLVTFFTEKTILQFIRNYKTSRIDKATRAKKNKPVGITALKHGTNL